jgi:hypothetical protein
MPIKTNFHRVVMPGSEKPTVFQHLSIDACFIRQPLFRPKNKVGPQLANSKDKL